MDYTEKFEKLLNKKPKSGSLKEWNKEWDALSKEFVFGNEKQGTEKKGKGGGKKKKQGEDVGDVSGNLEGKTPL